MIFALSKGHFSPSLRFFVDKNKKAKSPKCPILCINSLIACQMFHKRWIIYDSMLQSYKKCTERVQLFIKNALSECNFYIKTHYTSAILAYKRAGRKWK